MEMNILKKINFKIYRVVRKVNIDVIMLGHYNNQLGSKFWSKEFEIYRPSSFQRNFGVFLFLYLWVASLLGILNTIYSPLLLHRDFFLVLIFIYLFYLNNFKVKHLTINLVCEQFVRKTKIKIFKNFILFVLQFIVLPIFLIFLITVLESILNGQGLGRW